jgi:hypothetical protein
MKLRHDIINLIFHNEAYFEDEEIHIFSDEMTEKLNNILQNKIESCLDQKLIDNIKCSSEISLVELIITKEDIKAIFFGKEIETEEYLSFNIYLNENGEYIKYEIDD